MRRCAMVALALGLILISALPALAVQRSNVLIEYFTNCG